jgi:hypothetical protein
MKQRKINHPTGNPEYQKAKLELTALETKLHTPDVRDRASSSLKVARQYAETRERVRNLINNLT